MAQFRRLVEEGEWEVAKTYDTVDLWNYVTCQVDSDMHDVHVHLKMSTTCNGLKVCSL